MRVAVLVLALAPAVSAFGQSAVPAKPDVVQFHGTIDNVKYVFGVAPPVAHLKPGNILDANSLDCFGNALHKPGDSFSLVKGDNPLTGPFYVDGAEPGDTLVVRILDLQIDGKQGVGTFSPGFGAVNSTHYTPVLETKPLPDRMWFYPIPALMAIAFFIFVLLKRDNFFREIRYAAVIVVVGLIIFFVRSWQRREWPFASASISTAHES